MRSDLGFGNRERDNTRSGARRFKQRDRTWLFDMQAKVQAGHQVLHHHRDAETKIAGPAPQRGQPL